MTGKRQVVRSCLACRCQQEKADMLRLVVDESGTIWPDLLQQAPGRGTYLCMQAACLSKMSDKRLAAMRQKCHIVLPQWSSLSERLQDALVKMVYMQLSRLKPGISVGRDAVMHQMWKNAPLLLMLVNESGEALQRQVMNAVAKRQELGLKTIVLDGVPEAWLQDVFQREKVSVAALTASKQTEKLQRWCVWHGHLKGHKVSDGE